MERFAFRLNGYVLKPVKAGEQPSVNQVQGCVITLLLVDKRLVRIHDDLVLDMGLDFIRLLENTLVSEGYLMVDITESNV